MRLERVRPGVFRATLHAYELAALMAAARWVHDGAQGDVPEESRKQLEGVLASYNAELTRIER